MFSVCILNFKENYEISWGAGSFNMGTLVPNCSSELCASASKLLARRKVSVILYVSGDELMHVRHTWHIMPLKIVHEHFSKQNKI
jgi:hypothetical protein